MTELDTNIFRAVSSLYFEGPRYKSLCMQELDVAGSIDYFNLKVIFINDHYGINTVKIDGNYTIRLIKLSYYNNSDNVYIHNILAYIPFSGGTINDAVNCCKAISYYIEKDDPYHEYED